MTARATASPRICPRYMRRTITTSCCTMTHTYSYDLRGNRTGRTAKSDGTTETYAYDSQNRLTGYTSPATTATYAYDALDRRVAKVVGGTVEAYVYDAWGPGPTASDAALDFADGALTRRWLHGPRVDEPLAFESYAGTTAPGSGSVIELFARRLGSILLAVSLATGQVEAAYDYDAFGARTQTGTLEQRYGFTGRSMTPEAGLIHFRARAYDPRLGRFLQADPLGFGAGDLNLYAYTWNDPVNWTDPSGLEGENAVVTAGSVVIGANARRALGGGLTLFLAGIAYNLQNAVNAEPNDDAKEETRHRARGTIGHLSSQFGGKRKL